MSVVGKSARALIKTHLLSKPLIGNINLTGYRTFALSKSKNMKYVQFFYNDESPNKVRVGYLDGENVVDLNKADCQLPSTMIELLRHGDFSKVERIRKVTPNPKAVPLTSVTIKAPIHGMDKILCVGLNYLDHCKEQNLTPPKVPMIFSKFASSIIGQDESIKLRTQVTQKVDWEVEMAAVIGKKASNVKAADAYNYVFGYTVAQDISARDWQKEMNGGQFLLGKSQDTFCPLGPCIVTHDEIGDPQNLDISCSVDGVVKQKSNTSNLIHKIPDLIERLSSVMTLLPGDIILTGTPGGVGMHRDPPEYLAPGNVLRSEVHKIGAFEVKVDEFK